MMTEAYRIGMEVALSGNIIGALSSVIAKMAGIEGMQGRIEKGFLGWNKAIVGVGAAIGGAGILGAMKKLADHGKELSHELVQVQKLDASMTASQLERIKTQSYSMPGLVPGTTSVDALKAYGEMYSMFNLEGSLKMQKSILQFGQVLGNSSGDWNNIDKRVLAMIRAGDLMGKFVDSTTNTVDADKLSRFLSLGTKVIQATHNIVTPETWFQMAQLGAPALSAMSDEGLIHMAIAAQAMKGPRAGTSIMSLYSQMVGGRMFQFQAKLLNQLGLVGGFTPGKGGQLIWDKGALDTQFTKDLREDPMMAVSDIRAALEKQGKTTTEQQVPELFKILGRQTSIRLIHDMLRNAPQIMPEGTRIAGGMGIEGAANLANTQDYEQVMHNLTAAWKDMMDKIGSPISQAAIPIMQGFTKAFIDIGNWATAHPVRIQYIAGALTVLGVALVALGAAALAGSALIGALGAGGWLPAAIIGLSAAAAGVWVALHKDWKGAANEMQSGAASWWQAYWDSYKRVWSTAGLSALFTQIGAQLKTSADNSRAALGGFATYLGVEFPRAMREDWKVLQDVAKVAWEELKAVSTAGYDVLKSSASGFFEWIKGAWAGMWDGLKKALSDFGTWLKSFIPGMHGISGNASDISGFGGSSAGALSAGEHAQYAGIIKKVAAQEGVDQNALLKIYGTEGASAWYGDSGKSFGPFQLYTGGGLGNLYHGSRERSAAGVEEQTRYVARWGKTHGGWSSGIWHGLRGHGGSIPYRSSALEQHGTQVASQVLGQPRESALPPPRRQQQERQANVYLDNRIVGHMVERAIVHPHGFAHGTSDHDGRAGMPHVDSMSNLG